MRVFGGLSGLQMKSGSFENNNLSYSNLKFELSCVLIARVNLNAFMTTRYSEFMPRVFRDRTVRNVYFSAVTIFMESATKITFDKQQ